MSPIFSSTVLDTSSATSIPLRLKNIIGCSSSLLPIPYMTAATCLHMLAQSGQLHLNDISEGDGNSPFLDLNRSATSSGIWPLTSASMFWTLLAQRWAMADFLSSLRGFMSISTIYG